MEPMSAVADVAGRALRDLGRHADANGAQAQAAKLLGIPESAVTLHVTFLGGGFGRRGRADFVLDAVEASRAAKAPGTVLWTRTDDTACGDFHPVSLHRLSAGLDAAGNPTAWRHSWRSSSGRGRADARRARTSSAALLRGAYDLPYAIGAVRGRAVDFRRRPSASSSWRGVQHNHNVFATECFFDELAARRGKNPFAYRLALLRREAVVPGGRDGAPVDRARLAATLALAAEKARWSTPLAAGRGRGVACASYDGRTPAAVVAEVTVEAGGVWRVDRIVCAVDCGVAVNPLGVRAQVEGSVAWALSALVDRDHAQRRPRRAVNYCDFPILRLRDMPRVETHIVAERRARPTGMGEPPVPVTAAAVATHSPRPRAAACAAFPSGGRSERSLTWRDSRSSSTASQREIDAPEDMPLLWVLRDRLGLTGTKYGCGAGICGCLHGAPRRRGLPLVPGADLGRSAAKRVTTIEALAAEGLKQAWIAEDVSQCGYCQAGQIMQAAALLGKTPNPARRRDRRRAERQPVPLRDVPAHPGGDPPRGGGRGQTLLDVCASRTPGSPDARSTPACPSQALAPAARTSALASLGDYSRRERMDRSACRVSAYPLAGGRRGCRRPRRLPFWGAAGAIAGRHGAGEAEAGRVSLGRREPRRTGRS